jgi:predicted Zn-dependent protease
MSKYTDWLTSTGGCRQSGLNEGYDRNSLSEFEVSFDVLKVPGDEAPPDVEDELTEITRWGLSNPMVVLPRVRELLERYPDEPHLLNKLAAGLAADGQTEKARAVAELNYRKNPNYLFARLNYAEFLLSDREHEKIIEVLGGTFNLRVMYPQRTVFHATEVAGLMAILARYHIFNGNAIAASNAFAVLREVDPDHPTLEIARKVASIAVIQDAIKQIKTEARIRHARKNSRRRDRRDRKRR